MKTDKEPICKGCGGEACVCFEDGYITGRQDTLKEVLMKFERITPNPSTTYDYYKILKEDIKKLEKEVQK